MNLNRKNKNIITIVLLVLMIASLVLTLVYARKSVNNNQGNMPSINGGEPPEKPDGDNEEVSEKTDDNNQEETKPEMPSDNQGDQNKPEMPGEIKSNVSTIYYVLFGVESLIIATLIIYLIMSNFNNMTIKETFVNKDKIIIYILGSIIFTIGLTYLMSFLTTLNNSNNSNFNQNQDNNSSIAYSASKEITTSENINSGKFASSNSDENSILVSGDISVNLENISVSKTGDATSSGDNASFYGTNSGILAKGGANLTIDNAEIETDAVGANGVFSYGGSATTNNTSSDSTTITIKNTKITTKKDNSGGIMTTGGGNMNAYNLDVLTNGTSSAAIRSDRGGGNVLVDGGTYKTTGQGSPAIYSTANINVSNANLIATKSEGIVIEGKNSVTLDNCTLTDTNNTLNGKSTTYKNIFLYQSMSGDSSIGVSTFKATNSTITTNQGDTFYITNTKSVIELENNTFINNDTTSSFLRVQKDSWGETGNNGGDVELNTTNQKIVGNIDVDSLSTLTFNMTNNSYFEGSINNSNTAKSISLTLDGTSKIKLTEDTYLTSLTNSMLDNSNIDFNGYKLYVNGESIN